MADRDAWEIAIEGISNPRKLTLRELKTLGLKTVAMVLLCSGNGRGFLSQQTQWNTPGLSARPVAWSGVAFRCALWPRHWAARKAVCAS